MKKVLLLLLLFIVACGGSSKETTVQDTTTTTIPSAPTVDINIVEIYNIKLVGEVCSDAKDIDTTSEECLRQYRDNLENVFSYAEAIQTYITELNSYFESYPSEMTEEYKTLFQFVNDEYQAVPETYATVANKYIERFGGVPVLNSIGINSELWNECPADIFIEGTENIKSGTLIYENSIGEQVEIIINSNVYSFTDKLNVLGGEFILTSSKLTNYLDEEYENISSPVTSFYVNHWDAFFTKVEILNYDNSQVTVLVEWKDGILRMEAFSLLFQRQGLYEANMNVAALTKYGTEISNSLNKPSMFEGDYALKYLTYIEKSDNRTIVSYNFKKNQALELTEQPFKLNRIASIDPWYESKKIVYFYRFNDARTIVNGISFTRKVGCNGEGTVQNVNEDYTLSDFRFVLPFDTYESYFITKP
ncbi:MAG: hypothetical protein P8J65_00580 [Candidatus Actinomarina sp.]|nr:hypothetical protein [Candidatus Actinomarina sp.]